MICPLLCDAIVYHGCIMQQFAMLCTTAPNVNIFNIKRVWGTKIHVNF